MSTIPLHGYTTANYRGIHCVSELSIRKYSPPPIGIGIGIGLSYPGQGKAKAPTEISNNTSRNFIAGKILFFIDTDLQRSFMDTSENQYFTYSQHLCNNHLSLRST
ncbi:hypothetical protein Y032_0219g2449 [Ancylostoma ceylanicum]|uniref:Uncharacterized protein n=1 Tax=Ancylostoma ceylanicum TaxID=53326 RepID=A0A016SID2_9BILA|nr:hypothetical protein Y032_0219g2449 [Ancylostoma ceylanicum]